MSAPRPVIGLILAGGRGRRFGGIDKAAIRLGGETLIEHVATRLRPQVAGLWVAGGDSEARAGIGAVLPDPAGLEGAGPLAGILAGLIALRGSADGARLLSVPVDVPFLPATLAIRLATGFDGRPAVAVSRGRPHPVIALWPASLAEALDTHLRGSSDRSLKGFLAVTGWRAVEFADEDGKEPFLNINTPSDLEQAERRLRRLD